MSTDLARLLALVSDDLEHRQYAAAGVVRRAAQVIAGLPGEAEGCPVCGAEVIQSGRGRRRRYCSDPCRRRANRRRNATVGG